MMEEVIYVNPAQAKNLSRNERHIDEAVSSTSEYPLLHGLNTETKSGIDFPKTLAKFNTKYHADVVEWCPFSEYSDFFLSGTYELEEGEHEKWSGNISLCQLVLDDDKHSSTSCLKIHGTFELQSGVFDVKWDPCFSHEPRFVVASEDGLIDLYRIHLINSTQQPNVEKEQSINLATEKGVKPLSIDCDSFNSKNENSSLKLMISDSSGSLNHVVISSERENQRRWTAHSYEAWNAIYDYHVPDIVYSGGDDSVLKGWDLRTDLTIPTFQCRNHNMGVTSVAKHKEWEHLLASGSYDEHIFLWDIRKMRQPLSDLHIQNGGIWKLKWHPTFPNFLLSAAMHAGFFIVNIKDDSSMNIQTEYKEHSSLAYGVDWCKKFEWNINKKRNIIASCSFYDNLVHVWEVESLTM